jgi:hypothetical protein
MKTTKLVVLTCTLLCIIAQPALAQNAWWDELANLPFPENYPTRQSSQVLLNGPASTTSKLPPIAQLRGPDAADTHRITVAQAGTQVPNQKKPVDCAALQQDLFIDLKEVVKAGCTPSEAQIAKLMDNPVGNFVAVPFQYDYIQLEGPRTDTKVVHKLQIMPTFPISLGSDWNLINRVVFPFLSVPVNKGFGNYIGMAPGSIVSDPSFPGVLADPFERTNGFSDLVYVGLAAPKKPIKIESTGGAVIWGVGPTSMFPTASEDVLGTGKYSLGPAAVVGYLGREWIFGIFPQHWWSVGGDSKRADVSLTNSQYFLYYAPPWDPKAQWRIGMSPIISINWKAKGDKVTLPIGLGIERMFEIGQFPVFIQLEAEYSVIHPEDRVGSRWDFRLNIIPVIPTFLF